MDSANPILVAIISAILGGLSPMVIQYIQKRKSPVEVEGDRADIITKSAFKNVETAQMVNNQLQELLTADRLYYRETMDQMRASFNQQVDDDRADNERLIQGLRGEIDLLTKSSIKLRRRLSKYEDVNDTQEIEAIAKKVSVNKSMFDSQTTKAITDKDIKEHRKK